MPDTPRRMPVSVARGPARIPAWAEHLVRLLDDGFRIPGTRYRIGLDGIIGLLLPAAGDALSAVSSLALFLLAYQKRVPHSVLVRMLVNVALDALIGAIPVLGDLFDFAWKANRKNLELIERSARDQAQAGRPARLVDRLFVALVVVILLGLLILPFVLSIWLLARLVGGKAS
jgi:hypothetical protein